MSDLHQITIGSDHSSGIGATVPLEVSGVVCIRDLLLTIPESTVEPWWIGGAFEGGRRTLDSWISTSVLIADCDYRNSNGLRAAPPAEDRARVEQAIKSIDREGLGLHHTPRGVRVLVGLTEPEMNRARAERGRDGFYALVDHALKTANLLHEPLGDKQWKPGYQIDRGHGSLAHFFWTPRALVGGTLRNDHLQIVREGSCPIEELLRNALAATESKPFRASTAPPDMRRLGGWFDAVFRGEIRAVATAVANRNDRLMKASRRIGSVLGALRDRGIDISAERPKVEAALLDAARANHDVEEDGERKSTGTISRNLEFGLDHPCVLPDQKWDPPVPLDADPEVPEFPVEVLPDSLLGYVRAVAEETQTPIGLAGPLVLAACAACIARKVILNIFGRWREGANLYVIPVLPSSARKSAVMSLIRAPLKKWEMEAMERVRPDIALRMNEIRVLEEQIKHLQKEVGTGEGDAVRLKALVRTHSTMKPLPLPRLLCSDVTPERLAQLLSQQGERIAVFSAESEPLSIAAGRYSKNQEPNLELFLSGYTGESYTQDRMGRESVILEKPRITLAVCCQPAVLTRLAESEAAFRGQGFLSRILFSIPNYRPGYANTRPQEMSAKVEAEYHGIIRELLGLKVDGDEWVLTLSPSAATQFQEFRDWVEPEKREGRSLANIEDWAGKIEGNTARIALVIQAVKWAESGGPFPTEVDDESTQSAITIAHYFIDHARRAFSRMGTDPVLSLAARIVAWIEGRKLTEGTKRDVQRHVLRGQGDEARLLDRALGLLIECRYIRRKEDPSQPGPKGFTFEVSPWIVWQEPASESQEVEHA